MEPSIELTAESLWSEVSSRLRGALNETTYRTWFDHVGGVDLTDDEFVLSVPNDFARDWIEGHFLGLIRAAVGDATGKERRVQLAIVESEEKPAAPAVATDRRDDQCGGKSHELVSATSLESEAASTGSGPDREAETCCW